MAGGGTKDAVATQLLAGQCCTASRAIPIRLTPNTIPSGCVGIAKSVFSRMYRLRRHLSKILGTVIIFDMIKMMNNLAQLKRIVWMSGVPNNMRAQGAPNLHIPISIRPASFIIMIRRAWPAYLGSDFLCHTAWRFVSTSTAAMLWGRSIVGFTTSKRQSTNETL